MNENIEIFETAFVTAYFRATNTALSGDVYAHLWSSKRTQEYRDEYVSSVSDYEPFAHCLRNRFFLDKLKALFDKGEVEMLINFGCGFCMYPFLLPAEMEHIEIDMPASIEFKKKKVVEWMNQGMLPHRKLYFLAADFNTDYESVLLDQIAGLKGKKKSFILLEGVLFFVEHKDTDRLFKLFSKIQTGGEFVGSVSFQKSIEERKAFKKLAAFTKERLNANQKFEYQTVEDSYYKNLSAYTLVEHEDTFSLGHKYAPKIELPKEEVLDEHMYILKRN